MLLVGFGRLAGLVRVERLRCEGRATMAQIVLPVPDDLAQQLTAFGDRLPELLRLSLQQPAAPAHVYCCVLDFLASEPTPEQIAAFRPTPEMGDRLQTLLERERAGGLTAQEQAELEEYERIEHLIVLLKAGNLPALTQGV